MICPKCKTKAMKESGTNNYYCLQCNEQVNQKPSNAPQKRRNKYGNIPITIDGLYFPSQREGAYYGELKLRVKANDIKAFVVQPRFILVTTETKKIEYRADFLIIHNDDRVQVIDVKGKETPEFKMKQILFEKEFRTKLTLVK